MDAPCGKCERAGCGSYHDQCEEYMKFRKQRMELSEIKTEASERRTRFVKKSYRTPENSPLKCHRK